MLSDSAFEDAAILSDLALDDAAAFSDFSDLAFAFLDANRFYSEREAANLAAFLDDSLAASALCCLAVCALAVSTACVLSEAS